MPLSFSKVNNNIIELQETYKKAQPFPYIILDDFLDATDAEEVLREFPKIAEAGWIHYLHINEKKHGLNKLDAIPDAIKTIIGKFNSDEFVNFFVILEIFLDAVFLLTAPVLATFINCE